VAFYVVFVQAEREFIHIAGKMFLAGVVVDAVQPVSENSEYAFNAVCRDAAPRIFSFRVVYSFMRVVFRKALVGGQLIGMERRAFRDGLANGTLNRPRADPIK
jgi:hypothetical protein